MVPEPEPPKEEAEMSVPKKLAEATLAVSSGLAISGFMYQSCIFPFKCG